jgi:four helix bundle protein
MKGKEHFQEPVERYRSAKDFTSLICWQDAQKLKLFFYKKIIPQIPNYESNNLKNQIRRASISVTANIAEGYGRYHYQEGIQFYRMARASIYELKDHLISCYDLGYVGDNLLTFGIELIEATKIKLNGYIRYVIGLKQKS